MSANSNLNVVTPLAKPKLHFNVPKSDSEPVQETISGTVSKFPVKSNLDSTDIVISSANESDETMGQVEVAEQSEVQPDLKQSVLDINISSVHEDKTTISYDMSADLSFGIDDLLPLDPASFPNLTSKGKVMATIANVKCLLSSYGITVRYDIIMKKLVIVVPGYSGAPDNADNIALSYINSLASLNGMSTGQVPNYICVIGDRNLVNPVADWITSKPWDGVDRFHQLSDTLVHKEDFPVQFKETLIRKWLISAVAAALKPSGFRNRGVLTLQGTQSLGKSTWISSLIPDLILREKVLKIDHHIDAKNKDTFITAVSHWIVELGELDNTLKNDIAKLKGFLTSDRDKIRHPYGRANSIYPRRTVFAATVNDANFLVDKTGNSRWWTIPVVSVNYNHDIDMQQLFAQMAVEFNADKPWWLTPEEEVILESHNKKYLVSSVIRDRVLDELDLARIDEPNLPAMKPTQLLMHIGIKNPTNPQCKECAAVLREFLGESKEINGFQKWRIPLAKPTYTKPVSETSKKPIDDDMF